MVNSVTKITEKSSLPGSWWKCPCHIFMCCTFWWEHFEPHSQSSEDDFSLFDLVDPSMHGKKEFIATKAIISLTFTPHWEDREREREHPPPLLPSFFFLPRRILLSIDVHKVRERESGQNHAENWDPAKNTPLPPPAPSDKNGERVGSVSETWGLG